MGNRRGPHLNITGRLHLGEQKIPARVPDTEQKATFEPPEWCPKCGGPFWRQHGRQFLCVLCGEDMWLVMAPKEVSRHG